MGDCSCQGVRVTTSTLILVDSSELWRAERDAYEKLLSLPVSPILFFPGPERPDSFPRLGKPNSPASSLVWRSQVTFQKNSVSCPSALFPELLSLLATKQPLFPGKLLQPTLKYFLHQTMEQNLVFSHWKHKVGPLYKYGVFNKLLLICIHPKEDSECARTEAAGVQGAAMHSMTACTAQLLPGHLIKQKQILCWKKGRWEVARAVTHL